jgi:putative N6-adenine-specific DNA methylase
MKLIAKTLYGLEKALAAELKNIGASNIRPVNRAVLFEGDKYLLYKSNYCLRTAMSVLLPVAEFRIRSKDDLYRQSASVKWERLMGNDDTFSIVPVVKSPLFDHSGYPALVLKDSIADYFRKKTGTRPSVDQDDPALLINLHISNELVTISVDSSVVPLYKRGYRVEQPAAPLNEVLAAGILDISGWNASADFLDPMCGSGTFPIEAAMLASRMAPGKFRKFFGFFRWKDYDEQLFRKVVEDCDKLIVRPGINITGSDISGEAVRQSRANLEVTGLDDMVKIEEADFKNLKTGTGNEHLFLNPPYGLRLNPSETDDLYAMIGSTLKHNFSGCTAWIITPNRESLKFIGLKPAEKHTLYNGALECTLLKYELYQGSKKNREPQAPTSS